MLSNAFKFTEKGDVALRVFSQHNDSVSFAVRDTGVGIAPHQQEVIFEAFRQADGSIHRKFGGTGLGLSISRDLAALAGRCGHVAEYAWRRKRVHADDAPPLQRQCAADPGGASTPAREEYAPPLARTGKRSDPEKPAVPVTTDDRNAITPGGRVILLVEDDAAFAMILRDLVHEMGFQCIAAPSANEGLVAAAQFLPSAIILDVNLPDHSGLGVLDRLKRDPRTRHIPVHIVSISDYKREALELGAIGYALKPAKREELVGALRRMEATFSQSVRHVLVVEDDPRQRESIRHLLGNGDVQITAVASARDALTHLKATTFDCMVVDFNLPDYSGYDLLEKMSQEEDVAFPPVIIYTGRALSREEEQRLRRYSKSIIIKDARSPERLLDEVTLFLHQVEAKLPPEHQKMLKAARHRKAFWRAVEFWSWRTMYATSLPCRACSSPMASSCSSRAMDARRSIVLTRSWQEPSERIDLVLMDIMMPEMDGLTAMREIRKRPEWKNLPMIALTAKAMADDHDRSLAAGANDYIAKPLDVEKLLSLVRVWMPK